MSTQQLVLSAEQFAALAAGYGDAGAMVVLNGGQLAKRKLLIKMIVDATATTRHAPAVRSAVELIARAEEVDPVATGTVLAHPHLDAWAKRCLYRLTDPVEVQDAPGADGRTLGDDLGHLAGFAVAAALGTGLDFDVTLPTVAGVACVPGVAIASGLGAGTARAVGTGSSARFVGAGGTVVDRDGPGWQPRRTVELGPGHAVAIEDQDPYRHCYQWSPLSSLTDAQATGFAKLLTDAWQLIAAEHPAHAVAIRQAVRSVVPLAAPDSGMTISASSRHASGSIATSIPDTAAELALLLLHEHMHAKLGMLLDIRDLHTDRPQGRYHAPWRLDPRPVDALLQGVYAHTGVTDYWRKQRHSAEADRRRADAQYVYWRTMTGLAARALAGCGELTPSGEQFIVMLRNTLESWDRESAPADIESEVGLFVLAQTVRWRLANWQARDAETHSLADAVRTGGSPGEVAVDGMLVADGPTGPADAPGVLRHFHRWLGIGNPPTTTVDGSTDPAAVALVTGDPHGAARGFIQRLDRDAADDDAWIGLAVSLTVTSGSSERLLVNRPDLCRAAVIKLESEIAQAASAFIRWGELG